VAPARVGCVRRFGSDLKFETTTVRAVVFTERGASLVVVAAAGSPQLHLLIPFSAESERVECDSFSCPPRVPVFPRTPVPLLRAPLILPWEALHTPGFPQGQGRADEHHRQCRDPGACRSEATSLLPLPFPLQVCSRFRSVSHAVAATFNSRGSELPPQRASPRAPLHLKTTASSDSNAAHHRSVLDRTSPKLAADRHSPRSPLPEVR
jgi:hypothetical protein